MDRVYVFLAFIGFVIPYSVFISWMLNHGLDFSLLWQSIMDEPISLFAWLDVLIAAVAVLVYTFHQRANYSNIQIKCIALGTCLVGVSFSLPLLLYFNEINQKT